MKGQIFQESFLKICKNTYYFLNDIHHCVVEGRNKLKLSMAFSRIMFLQNEHAKILSQGSKSFYRTYCKDPNKRILFLYCW